MPCNTKIVYRINRYRPEEEMGCRTGFRISMGDWDTYEEAEKVLRSMNWPGEHKSRVWKIKL
jgi:S-ribosylhomocysteine lyase LuxS involved in autoinducer biosynthesis